MPDSEAGKESQVEPGRARNGERRAAPQPLEHVCKCCCDGAACAFQAGTGGSPTAAVVTGTGSGDSRVPVPLSTSGRARLSPAPAPEEGHARSVFSGPKPLPGTWP